jgi:hypothetical protein
MFCQLPRDVASEGAVFLLDDLATAAQELLNIALVSGLRRERHQQPLVHVAGARVAHLTGRVAQALKENEYLFEETPSIETADVLAAHLPGG